MMKESILFYENRGHESSMWNFLKQNGHNIFKLIITQVGITMFGLMLSMATYENDTLLLLTSIFSVGFYLVLLYTSCWDCGSHEKVRVDAKRLRYQPWKGLWLALAANVLNFLLAAAVFISGTMITDFAAGLPAGAYKVYFTFRYITQFLLGMYSGLVILYAPYNTYVFFLVILPSLAVCALGYYFGVHDRRLLGFLQPKKQEKQ